MYCGNNERHSSINGNPPTHIIGTPYTCFKKGVGVGLHLPVDTEYGEYKQLVYSKPYCGKKKTLPNNTYTHFGTNGDCLRKGVGVGKKIRYTRAFNNLPPPPIPPPPPYPPPPIPDIPVPSTPPPPPPTLSFAFTNKTFAVINIPIGIIISFVIILVAYHYNAKCITFVAKDGTRKICKYKFILFSILVVVSVFLLLKLIL